MQLELLTCCVIEHVWPLHDSELPTCIMPGALSMLPYQHHESHHVAPAEVPVMGCIALRITTSPTGPSLPANRTPEDADALTLRAAVLLDELGFLAWGMPTHRL